MGTRRMGHFDGRVRINKPWAGSHTAGTRLEQLPEVAAAVPKRLKRVPSPSLPLLRSRKFGGGSVRFLAKSYPGNILPILLDFLTKGHRSTGHCRPTEVDLETRSYLRGSQSSVTKSKTAHGLGDSVSSTFLLAKQLEVLTEMAPWPRGQEMRTLLMRVFTASNSLSVLG